MGLTYMRGSRDLLATLAPTMKRRIKVALQRTEQDPRDGRLDLKRLRTHRSHTFYRCRVGDYRIVYTPVPGGAVIWRIFHRADGYEWIDLFGPHDKD